MAETLIQPSLAQDPNVIALAALPERITYLDVSPVITHDIDRVPASVLPHLADQFHMRHTVAWRRAQTDAERRGLVKVAIARHRIKGTLAGFRLAAQAGCRADARPPRHRLRQRKRHRQEGEGEPDWRRRARGIDLRAVSQSA